MDVVDKTRAIIKISKMIQKETTRAKAEEFLGNVLKYVVAFDLDFDGRIRARLPSCWEILGGLVRWEKYDKILVQPKSKEKSSHEKTSTLKGNTIVKYV